LNKEYLPIEGLAEFNLEAAKLMFGENNEYIKKGCIATVQAVSGCGALRIGFELLK
jgi:aspartate/tyrosine/aromatic aminotransferase